MPKSSSDDNLFGKWKDRIKKAHDQHKDDDTDYGQMELPAGINNGIAQIVDCRIGHYEKGDNKGQPFFHIAAITVEPEEFEGVPCAGVRTSHTEPLCDTPSRSRKTVEEHVAWMYNELRKCGIDTSSLDPDDLPQTFEALIEAAPHIRFRTWRGKATDQYPDPRTNHEWNGLIDYTPSGGSPVEDKTPPAPPKTAPKPEQAKPTPPTPAPRSPQKSAPKAPPPPPPQSEPTTSPDFTLEDLVNMADQGNDEAIDELTRQALELGMTQEEVDTATSWQSVAEYISQQLEEQGGEGGGDGTQNGWAPEKGEMYPYKPSPRAKKPIECEVISVNEGAQTVTLRSAVDKKTMYKDVPWGALAAAE
jgi:hypothetical protein